MCVCVRACVFLSHLRLLHQGSDGPTNHHNDHQDEEGSIDKEDDLGDDVVCADGGNETDNTHNHHHKAKDDEDNGDVEGRGGDYVNVGRLCCLYVDGEGRGRGGEERNVTGSYFNIKCVTTTMYVCTHTCMHVCVCAVSPLTTLQGQRSLGQ